MMIHGTCYKTFCNFLCVSDWVLDTAVYKLKISLPCKVVLPVHPYLTVYLTSVMDVSSSYLSQLS